MSKCCFCKSEFPEERLEMGYAWCIKCADANPKLSKPEFLVLGQHKSVALVMAPDDPLVLARVSYMNR